MSTELATIDNPFELASRLSEASTIPKALQGKPADILFAILTGRALGIPDVRAISLIDIIEGKPCLQAQGMLAVVLRSGLSAAFDCIDDTPTSVTYETRRKDSTVPQRVTFTMEDARRAGLTTKDNWRHHPRDMLHWRAISKLCRRVYPDVVAGVYTPDEIDDIGASRAAPQAADFADADVLTESNDLDADIASASSVESLRALAPRVNKVPDAASRARVKANYKARMAELQAAPAAEEPAAEVAA